jgi:hypothetical protein
VPDAYDSNRVNLATYGTASKFGGLNAQEVFELVATDQPIPGTTPYKLLHGDDSSDPGASSGTDSDASAPTGTDGTGTGTAEANDPATAAATPPADDEFVTALTAPVECEATAQ